MREGQMSWLQLGLFLMLAIPSEQVPPDAMDVAVEHALGMTDFSEAGRLYGSLPIQGGSAAPSLEFSWQSVQEDAFLNLIKAGWTYRVRVPSDPRNTTSPRLTSSIPALCLAQSSGLQLHATSSGSFTSLNIVMDGQSCGAEHKVPTWILQAGPVKVPVVLPVIAPRLQKTMQYLQPDESEGRLKAKPKGQEKGRGTPAESEGTDPPPEDTRPWIVKNWMIALPIGFVIMNLLGNLAPVENAAPAARAPTGNRRR